MGTRRAATAPRASDDMALLLATWGPTDEGEWRRMVDDLTIAPGDVVDEWRSATGELRLARGAPLREASDRSPIVSRADCTMVVDGWIGDIEHRGYAAAETALDAYLRWGPRFASRLEGEFSFLLHDAQARTLFVGCDVMGTRAPAWFCKGDVVVVASRAVSILKHSAAPLRWNQRYFAHIVSEIMCMPAELTAFEDVRRLVPGATLRFERAGGSVRMDEVFRDVLAATALPKAHREIEELLLETIDAATARRIGNARIALALSGGLDSAVIATSLRQTVTSLDAYALIDGGEPSGANPALAAIVERIGGIRLERIPAEGAYGFGDESGPLTDDPIIAGPAMQVARTLLYRTVAEAGVDRLFNGEGGDELFEIAWRSPRALRRMGVVAAIRDLVLGPPSRLVRAVEASNLPAPLRRGFLVRRIRGLLLSRTWLTPSFLESDAVALACNDWLDATSCEVGAPRTGRVIASMQRNLLAQSAAHRAVGIEQTSPMLDLRVARFAAGLPVTLAKASHCDKVALRRASARRLPPKIVQAKKVEELDTRLCSRALGCEAQFQATTRILEDCGALREALRPLVGTWNDPAVRLIGAQRVYRLLAVASWAQRIG